MGHEKRAISSSHSPIWLWVHHQDIAGSKFGPGSVETNFGILSASIPSQGPPSSGEKPDRLARALGEPYYSFSAVEEYKTRVFSTTPLLSTFTISRSSALRPPLLALPARITRVVFCFTDHLVAPWPSAISTMLVFIPLLVAYTTLWSSILVFKVPIPTPDPLLSTSAAIPFPLHSIVSVVQEINTVIDSLPAVSDLLYSVTVDTRFAWHLDAPPVSPIPLPPPLDQPTCVSLDWPPLSDFSYFGTGTCDRVSSTDLVVWGGPSESLDLFSWFAPSVNGQLPGDIWYFITLAVSGAGVWLACRLIEAAASKWSASTSVEVRCHSSTELWR